MSSFAQDGQERVLISPNFNSQDLIEEAFFKMKLDYCTALYTGFHTSGVTVVHCTVDTFLVGVAFWNMP